MACGRSIRRRSTPVAKRAARRSTLDGSVRAAGSSVPGTQTDEVDLLDRVAIQRRFSGPATSANGGYVCGLLARFVGVAAQITLRRPPPLEHDFSIVRFVDGRVAMTDGDLVIADAIRSAVHHVVPRPVGVADAVLAQRVPTAHPFPTCFVCGPERADGLRLFAGPCRGGTSLPLPGSRPRIWPVRMVTCTRNSSGPPSTAQGPSRS